jgi:hypothetical protein
MHASAHHSALDSPGIWAPNRAKTKAARKTLNPVWDETVEVWGEARDVSSKPIRLECGHACAHHGASPSSPHRRATFPRSRSALSASTTTCCPRTTRSALPCYLPKPSERCSSRRSRARSLTRGVCSGCRSMAKGTLSATDDLPCMRAPVLTTAPCPLRYLGIVLKVIVRGQPTLGQLVRRLAQPLGALIACLISLGL